MRPHTLNRSFRWQPPRGPFRRVSSAQARDWDERGYFVVRDAFDSETVARITAAIDPFEARTTEFLRTQPEGTFFIARADAITFTVHLAARSAELREFVAGPPFGDLGHDLLGPDVRLYWDQAVYKKPEPEREFPWHQDNGYTFIEPQAYLTCWVALTDADETNGCPWVAPGRHREGTLDHRLTETGWRCFDGSDDAEPLRLGAGSIAVFSSLTPHRTGPNRTGSVRKSYIVQLAPDGARRIDVDADGVRRETLQNAPDRQFFIVRGGEAVAAPPLPRPGSEAPTEGARRRSGPERRR